MVDLNSEGSVSVVRRTPEQPKPVPVVEINGRKFIANGRWNTEAVANYVLEEGYCKWLMVGEVAKFTHFSNNIPNKKKIRARLSPLFKELMRRGVLLAIEYAGENHAASAIKVADLTSKHERELVLYKIAKMKKSREMSEVQYEQSLLLFHKMMCIGD